MLYDDLRIVQPVSRRPALNSSNTQLGFLAPDCALNNPPLGISKATHLVAESSEFEKDIPPERHVRCDQIPYL